MSDGSGPGHYRGEDGSWKPERRVGDDRRSSKDKWANRERRLRSWGRRKVDDELMEHDHREMIADALEDFASEHDKA